MKTDFSIEGLSSELESVLANFGSYHNKMSAFMDYYDRSAFYPTKSGDVRKSDFNENLLKVYADMNVKFTSAFPNIKVPTTGSTPQERQAASIREKILLATWKKSGGKNLQRQWAFDGTLKSLAVAETTFDILNRRVVIKRHEPHFVCWSLSNANEKRITAFWALWPITKTEAQKRYGITPTTNPLPRSSLASKYFSNIDGQEWFLMAKRWDADYRCAFIGDKFVEEPHNHMMGEIPVDICEPFYNNDDFGRGAFYLEPLLTAQAELNLTQQRRSAITKRMAEPVIWSRGMISKQFDELKSGLKTGGMVGLKAQGDIGILQLNDVKLLDTHADECRQAMLRLSGFSSAAMGELAGANTSGDALGMYFTPTQRHIENQNIAWTSFYESINAKILRAYETFLKITETATLSGFAPASTVLAINSDNVTTAQARSGFDIQFNRQLIGGQYGSIVEMSAITPKNAIEERRLYLDAVTQGFLSRTTAYEGWGLESPEDELALLSAEQQRPELNTHGMAELMGAASKMQQPQITPPPQPTPQAQLPTGQ